MYNLESTLKKRYDLKLNKNLNLTSLNLRQLELDIDPEVLTQKVLGIASISEVRVGAIEHYG